MDADTASECSSTSEICDVVVHVVDVVEVALPPPPEDITTGLHASDDITHTPGRVASAAVTCICIVFILIVCIVSVVARALM